MTKVKVLNESGYKEALLGLSLSYNKPISKMEDVADRLYNKGGGHSKFLESIQVWLDMTMPRYFWQEFDTYRVGTTKQSESTMHTIFKQELAQDNFVQDIPSHCLDDLNYEISWYKKLKEYFTNEQELQRSFRRIKVLLPEGFLQRRVVNTNYMVLRNMIQQRKNHRLEEWAEFIKHTQENCKYSKWLV